MQPADHRPGGNAAKPLDWSTVWRILGQRKVRANLVVVVCIQRHDPRRQHLDPATGILALVPWERLGYLLGDPLGGWMRRYGMVKELPPAAC